MEIKMLECQHCKKVQIADSYEELRHPDSSRVHWMPSINPTSEVGFDLPYIAYKCPECGHCNYSDNVSGFLKYTHVEVNNTKIKEIIENGL